MTRLIDADALIDKVDKYIYRITRASKLKVGESAIITDIKAHIELSPTIDAEPVRHGKWACDAIGVLRCSECKAQAPWRFVGRGYNEVDYRWKSDYCPNCGAKMENAREDDKTD